MIAQYLRIFSEEEQRRFWEMMDGSKWKSSTHYPGQWHWEKWLMHFRVWHWKTLTQWNMCHRWPLPSQYLPTEGTEGWLWLKGEQYQLLAALPSTVDLSAEERVARCYGCWGSGAYMWTPPNCHLRVEPGWNARSPSSRDTSWIVENLLDWFTGSGWVMTYEKKSCTPTHHSMSNSGKLWMRWKRVRLLERAVSLLPRLFSSGRSQGNWGCALILGGQSR